MSTISNTFTPTVMGLRMSDHGQGNGVFIPAVDEYEDQGGDDAGGCHGQQDLHHSLNTVAAVDGSSLLHLSGDGHEGTAQQPDGEGLVESSIDEDQTQQGVGQLQELDDLVNTCLLYTSPSPRDS